jgi:hypothetical protein
VRGRVGRARIRSHDWHFEEEMSENSAAQEKPSRVRRTTEAAHAGLDVMLSEAAAGGPPRFVAPGAAVRVSVGLARHPGRVASRAARLTSELRRVAGGRSEIAPARGDRRFTDPAWARSWLFRRLLQGYLAVGETVDGLISDSDVDWRAERRARLAASNVIDALAPTNFPWSNPEVMCALDNDTEGTMSALASRDVAAAAVAESARKGYLDGQALQGVFTWLRPNDLVWNYVVNNYLLGKEPPAFDILYWNQDTVRLAAGLHRDFIHIGLDNSFTRPGALEVLGQPVDLQHVDLDTYFVAGLTDHIVPWESAYNGARLFGGARRFVLSRSGHIQALVNPPPAPGAESRASYRVADELPETAEEYLAQAPRLSGSWWSDWDSWLAERSGERKPAPKALGNRAHKAQAKAPGTYVLAN